jgi:membrane protease YdiL (CAAX protease family)
LPVLFLVAWGIIHLSSEGLQIAAAGKGFYAFIRILLLTFAMNLILGGSMGEEFGWRGFLLPVLLQKYNPAGASLILGMIWAIWHLPVDLSSQIAAAPFMVIFRIVWTLPLTVIFTWFFLKTKGSI